jgi:hypothetical protein
VGERNARSSLVLEIIMKTLDIGLLLVVAAAGCGREPPPPRVRLTGDGAHIVRGAEIAGSELPRVMNEFRAARNSAAVSEVTVVVEPSRP